MSLRAKIEAVVYAAEEPVTLAQLASVFAPEIREAWQAAQTRAEEARSGVQSVRIREVGEPASPMLPLTGPPETESIAEPDAPEPDTAELGASDTGAPEQDAVNGDAEATAKRAARQDERAIREHLRSVLNQLMAELQSSDRGVEIREIAGGYRMATKPEYHDAIRSPS